MVSLIKNTLFYRDTALFEAIAERTQSQQSFKQYPMCTKTIRHMLRLVSVYYRLLLL